MNRFGHVLHKAVLLLPFLAGCASAPDSPGNGFTTPELAGTRWIITSIDGRDPLGPVLTADFGSDGRVSGDAGCNSFSGPYIQSGKSVQFGELLSTRRACVDENRQRQETRLLNILQGSSTLQLSRSRLTVRSGQGYVVLKPGETETLGYRP